MKKNSNYLILDQVFQNILIIYLVLILVEQLLPEQYNIHINLNYILIIYLILGICLLILKKCNCKCRENVKYNVIIDLLYIYILSLFGGIIILNKTVKFGILGYLITIAVVSIIFFYSYLMIKHEDK
jgi:hypothetical protein